MKEVEFNKEQRSENTALFLAQESGGSPCPSSCPDLNKSQTLSSLSESGAVLVEVCCLLVLAVDNKVLFCISDP